MLRDAPLDMPDRYDALILDGSTRGSIAVTRWLGRAGYRLAVATYGPGYDRRFTRYGASFVHTVAPHTDIDGYAAALLDWLRAHPADVILTAKDKSAVALERRREEFQREAHLGLPSSAALLATLNKEATLAAAERRSLPVPRSVHVTSAEEAAAAAVAIGYPCVLKPDESWQVLEAADGRRVVSALVTTPGEMVRAADRMLRPDAGALVQEYAPGRREAITVFRQGGRVTAAFAMAATRTWPPLGGASVMREAIAMPEDSLQYSVDLTEELGYEGYGEVEFRRAADGRPLLMEINPRFSASVELALRAGMNFGAMQLEWARGNAPAEQWSYRVGTRLSWLGGELRSLASPLLGAPDPRPRFWPTLADIAADYFPPPRIDSFELRDPGPTLVTLRTIAANTVARIRR